MKYVDEFRDPVKAAGLIQQIEQLSIRISEKREKVTKIMEVCGNTSGNYRINSWSWMSRLCDAARSFR